MTTENARLPQPRPIPARMQDSSLYHERFQHKELWKESVELVRPVMMNLGELLDVIFLAKGHKSDSRIQKYHGLAEEFIFSCIDGGSLNIEDFNDKNSDDGDEDILEDIINVLKCVNNKSRRELWSGETFLYDVPLAVGVRELLAYAYQGLGPWNTHRFEETVKHEEYVKKLVEATKAAVATPGLGSSATQSLSTLLLAAEARLALDEGRDVTPEQLAALARIKIKSMRNALAPLGGSGLEMRDGAVTAESALNWLHARGDYKATLWPDDKSSIAPVAEPIAGEVLFVPFAGDGIEFHPVKCRRDGKYTVGPKGAEQSFTDYRAALDCLARMKPASYWKHPNTANNWGTVTAIGFRPRTPAELGLEPAEGGEK